MARILVLHIRSTGRRCAFGVAVVEKLATMSQVSVFVAEPHSPPRIVGRHDMGVTSTAKPWPAAYYQRRLESAPLACDRRRHARHGSHA